MIEKYILNIFMRKLAYVPFLGKDLPPLDTNQKITFVIFLVVNISIMILLDKIFNKRK